MMQQANFEFGFEAEDIPLMIEAIPMNAECVVLLITKVEDPEELDTRFAHFSPSDSDADDDEDEDLFGSEQDDMLDMIHNMQSARQPESAAPGEAPSAHSSRTFRFRALSDVMNAAQQAGSSCRCPNTLYKDAGDNGYLLAVSQGEASPEEFNRLCTFLSEYGVLKRGSEASQTFLEEHCEALLSGNALQNLC